MSDRLSRMSRKTATDDVEKDDDDDIERTITRTLWRKHGSRARSGLVGVVGGVVVGWTPQTCRRRR